MAARPLCRLPIRCARAAPFRRSSTRKITKRERETNEVVIGFVLVFLPGCSLPWFGDLRTGSSLDGAVFLLPRINSVRISSPAHLGQKTFP
jgi:hypothetical protein